MSNANVSAPLVVQIVLWNTAGVGTPANINAPILVTIYDWNGVAHT